MRRKRLSWRGRVLDIEKSVAGIEGRVKSRRQRRRADIAPAAAQRAEAGRRVISHGGREMVKSMPFSVQNAPFSCMEEAL